MAIWFSLTRRASRDLLAAMLFLRRRAQYLSSFKSSGTYCRKQQQQQQHRYHQLFRRILSIQLVKQIWNFGIYLFYIELSKNLEFGILELWNFGIFGIN